MLRKRRGAPREGLNCVVGVAVMLAGAWLATLTPAHAAKATWFSGYSEIVVDAKTGEVIDSAKADELRHPASLAKIMTLYLLFSELEAGRLKLDSKIRVSADAAAQPPSKLGIKAGGSLDVDDAIKAVVTRSGNDIAVAIAEAIAGDEESFARLMTQRARALGMSRTVFKNASGLPDPEQVTTAREMALLGLAIQDRFPKYYSYFSTRKFHWRGVAIGNHNRLLGRVQGVDGIKTGYTRASGFNLVTNVKRGGRHIVAVVMGGRTGAVRDRLMRELIAKNIRHAHTGPRTTPRFTETPIPLPPPSPLVAIANRANAPASGSDVPIQGTPVRIVPIDKEGARTAKPASAGRVLPISTMSAGSVSEPLRITPTALARDGRVVTFAPPPASAMTATASTQDSPEIERAKVVSALLPEEVKTVAKVVPIEQETPVARGEWIVQIGAYAKEEQARERLAEARERAAVVLQKRSPYTEKTTQGRNDYYRARFAGFDEDGAKRACATLKKNDFPCFVTRN